MIKKAWALSRWRRVNFDDVYGQLQRYVCVCVLCAVPHPDHARILHIACTLDVCTSSARRRAR